MNCNDKKWNQLRVAKAGAEIRGPSQVTKWFQIIFICILWSMKKDKKINEISSIKKDKKTVPTENPDLWMNTITKQLSL